ncbi:MAG TPA: M48 family metallopeptidase [Geobacteraceae bacterium]|nr:M48 family metallopeptidase [Geobacteraceae bacterium]
MGKAESLPIVDEIERFMYFQKYGRSGHETYSLPIETNTRKEDNQLMQELKYLAGYSEKLTNQVNLLIAENKLEGVLLKKYPSPHDIKTEKALYDFTVEIKNEYLRKSQPLSKVIYDGKIHVINHALGTHTFVSRVQGAKLKAKNEIRIASVFRNAPLEFLKMIVVHELAHLKEKDHDKAFYKLCEYMEPAYHQLEFDTRLYLTHLDLAGSLTSRKSLDKLDCR